MVHLVKLFFGGSINSIYEREKDRNVTLTKQTISLDVILYNPPYTTSRDKNPNNLYTQFTLQGTGHEMVIGHCPQGIK